MSERQAKYACLALNFVFWAVFAITFCTGSKP